MPDGHALYPPAQFVFRTFSTLQPARVHTIQQMVLPATLPIVPLTPPAQRTALFITLVALGAGILGLALYGPIPQDPHYHEFADRRAWLGIANCGDVASNAPFLLVGVLGLLAVYRLRHAAALVAIDRVALVVFFLGIGATAFGSAYYHWNPTNAALVWDRIPMAVAFAGLLGAVVADRISTRAAALILSPAVVLAVAAVAYWSFTESQGRGDLRPYSLVQFGTLIVVVMLIATRPARYLATGPAALAAAFYVAAKLLEHYDQAIFDALAQTGTPLVSGHTLKHLAAACAPGVIAWHLWRLARRTSSVPPIPPVAPAPIIAP
ncbi:hypothetical protein BH11PLA1_BH11PLA1_22500 [soil metagenome]